MDTIMLDEEEITYPVFVARTNPQNLPVQQVVNEAIDLSSRYLDAPQLLTIDQEGNVEWTLKTLEGWKEWAVQAANTILIDDFKSALSAVLR